MQFLITNLYESFEGGCGCCYCCCTCKVIQHFHLLSTTFFFYNRRIFVYFFLLFVVNRETSCCCCGANWFVFNCWIPFWSSIHVNVMFTNFNNWSIQNINFNIQWARFTWIVRFDGRLLSVCKPQGPLNIAFDLLNHHMNNRTKLVSY